MLKIRSGYTVACYCRTSASACDTRAQRLINLSRARTIDTNIGWTVRLDRRYDIVPPVKPPSAVFFFCFCFISRLVRVPSGFPEFPTSPNGPIARAISRVFKAGDVPAGTEEPTHSERSARNALSAVPRRVILSIWPFLSRERKSPRVQLVCETTGPVHESLRNVPEERDLRAD